MYVLVGAITLFEDEIRQAKLRQEEVRQRLQRLSDDQARTYAAIQRATAELYQLMGYVEALEKIFKENAEMEANVERTTSNSQRKRIKNPEREKVVAAALGVIEEAGRPLSRQELYETLSERGLTITGKDPLMVFSTMLWRSKNRIVRLRGHGYWPTNRSYPPANYFPEEPGLI